MTNNKVNGEYVPGAAYEGFLKEKQKPSYINFIATVEKSLGIPESQRKYKRPVEELDINQNRIKHPPNAYIPGKPYQYFLKEKNSPSFVNYMDNIKRLLSMDEK